MLKTKVQWHAKQIKDLVTVLKTDLQTGLTENDYRKRLEKYGANLLKQKQQKGKWQIFLEQFASPIVWLLIAACITAFIFDEIPEGIAIILVILINSGVGFFMEWQAVRSMDALLKMGRAQARVIRNGNSYCTDSANLVPGDVICLEAGDLVTADARLFEQHSLGLKEAALTGESNQIDKQTHVLDEETFLSDRTNLVFKGTVVSRGKGKGVVIATGDQTELGRISALAQEAEKGITPLDKRLNELSKTLIWLTIGISIVIFLSGLVRGSDWIIMMETALALAVAAIPEGLPVIATITLARGMVKLADKKAIVKTLEAVQTLGETNVIFTDKTGTLTENSMFLDSILTGAEQFRFSDLKKENRLPFDAELLLKTGAYCNNSSFSTQPNGEKSSGDPIEVALLRTAYQFLNNKEIQPLKQNRIAEIPFDADRKMMGTIHLVNGSYLISVKGATEVLLQHCNKTLNAQGEEVPLQDKDFWNKKTAELAGKGFRVLGFAYRTAEAKPDPNDFLNDLIFIGVGCFVDPPRSEVREAILSCKQAGIKVIMVTGDHPETASHIAEKVGMVNHSHETIKVLGDELLQIGKLTGTNRQRILSANIFARTTPSQKLDLVEFYQDHHFIVGMTGDGVNDAPALKKADIGIAMGQRGTEAAKEVADIVLKDDSFSSIVLAIQQGRIIFKNIRMFVIYLLSCNLSEILVVGTAVFLGIPFPLLPLQILFLNMVTDVFPALALGMSEGEKGTMLVPPRKVGEPIISRNSWIAIISYGISMTVAVLGVEFFCIYYLDLSDVEINNITFYTLVLVQLWNVFNIPGSRVSFFRNVVTKNKYVWISLLVSILFVGVAWWIDPIREALSLIQLQPFYWLIIFISSFFPLLLIQFLKRILKVIK